MGIDHRRHHRLAGQVDVDSAGRHRDRALSPDARNAAVLHHDSAVLKGWTRVSENQARTFVHGCAGRWLRDRDRGCQRDRCEGGAHNAALQHCCTE
jgi:hypothetical protein